MLVKSNNKNKKRRKGLDNEIYLTREYQRFAETDDLSVPLKLYQCEVSKSWVDYNNHMSESFYLFAFGDASDALFRYIGIDEAYRESGSSFYTVETHINFFLEASTAEPLYFTTQLLGLDEKRLHFFHSMYHGETDALLATTEQMLLHVDMQKSTAAPIKPQVHQVLENIMQAHRVLPKPSQVGRVMQVKAKK
jgi:carnitine 3-dehydrogenase